MAKTCACLRSLNEDLDAIDSLVFFEDHLDGKFYDEPSPSEDIWKKFELLTPPVSPSHEIAYQNGTLDLDNCYSQTELSLDAIIPTLSLDDCHICSSPEHSGIDSDSNSSVDSNLNTNLIKDCMWSGLNLAKDLFEGRSVSQDTINTVTSTISANMDINATTDCVDPAAVFPYPINVANIIPHTTAPTSANSSSNLGTETPSDSEDEEIDVVTVNDKVQITRRKPILPGASTMSAQVAAMHNYNVPASQAPPSPVPKIIPGRSARSIVNPISPPRAPSARIAASPRPSARAIISPRSTVRLATSPRRPLAVANHIPTIHSYSVKRGRRERDTDAGCRPPVKKLRISLPAHLQSSSSQFHPRLGHVSHSARAGGHGGGDGCNSSGSSRNSSDSEDGECRRSQHNILERKRRNDLKYSFHQLRDHVPNLDTEKAPKVTILRKAAEYITGLQTQEQQLSKQLEFQRHKKEQLMSRLRELQRSLAAAY